MHPNVLHMSNAPTYLFWMAWSVNALASLLVGALFMIGTATASIGVGNVLVWQFLLLVIGTMLYGSVYLRRRGRRHLSWLLVAAMAIPSILFLIIVCIATFGDFRWN